MKESSETRIMNGGIILKQLRVYVRGLLMVIGAAALLTGCAAQKVEKTNADNEGKDLKWELAINKLKIDGKVNIGEFIDDKKGITVGYSGEIHYTEDGGKTWPTANNQSLCRFGISMVDEKVAAACGNSGEIRISTDGGKNWNSAGKFLEKNFYISFIDDKNGWVADSYKLAVTTDGGKTYNEMKVPADINRIATVSMVKQDLGYLLNGEGRLFATKDGGKTWSSKDIMPGGEKISINTGGMQYSAIRFIDDKNGVVAIINKDNKKIVLRTQDGGDTWKKEDVPESELAFGVTISPDGRYITFTGATNTVSVLKYKG